MVLMGMFVCWGTEMSRDSRLQRLISLIYKFIGYARTRGLRHATKLAMIKLARSILKHLEAGEIVQPVNPLALGSYTNHEQIRRYFQSRRGPFLRAADSLLETRPFFTLWIIPDSSWLAGLEGILLELQNQIYSDFETYVQVPRTLTQSEHRRLNGLQARFPHLHLTDEGLASNISRFRGDLILCFSAGDHIDSETLLQIAFVSQKESGCQCFYTDHDLIAGNDTTTPFFKPDWSPEYFSNRLDALYPLVMRKASLEKIGAQYGVGGGIGDLRMIYQKLIETGATGFHLREALFHRSQETDRIVRGWTLAKVQPAFKGVPLVSIVIPTNDTTRFVDGLGVVNYPTHLIQSIFERTTYVNFEVILVDNFNLSAKTKADLEKYPISYQHFKVGEKGFNFSQKINYAMSFAKGEYLVMLNDDMEVTTPDWIEQLLEYAHRPGIGVVGGKLIYPNQTIQHAGVCFNRGEAIHVYHGQSKYNRGHQDFIHSVKNFLAVTGACSMIPAKVWQALGGYDENLAIDLNDVDFCLRAFERGLRVVYNPSCELVHFHQGTMSHRIQSPADREVFFSRWSNYAKYDPFVNGPAEQLLDVDFVF
ncbi:MAG: hypothetical protein C5B49_16390 [Bdellovibrio sp.]|nr:MAG: hypothetical protein C5B49_16390 [Bdellovibrio sp.]